MIIEKTETCNYIDISSEQISDFIENSANYTSFQIKGKLNCCDEESVETLDSETIIAGFDWNIAFPNGEGTIKEFEVENYISGEKFNILSTTYDLADYVCSTGTITDFFPIAQQWFTDNFATTISQSYVYDGTTLECTYSLANLPASIRPTKIVVERNGVDEEIYFESFPLTNVFINGSSVIVSPEFFNLEEFPDGVYSFEITYETTLGSTIVESNCFFFDCETACKVSEKLEELLECNKTATNIFLLHYSLTEGNNCGCNCEEMCQIFIKLCEELGHDKTCTSCGC